MASQRLDSKQVSEFPTIRHGTRVKADGSPNNNLTVSPHSLKFTDLPYDILVEIFTALLPTEHNSSMHPAQAPTVLTHISRCLREVALSTPTLWSSIDIPINSADRFDPLLRSSALVHKKGEVVSAWLLHRSGACDVDISLNETSAKYKAYHETSDAVIRAISSSSQRWRKVSFECSGVTFCRIMSLVNGHSLPRLRSFRLLFQAGCNTSADLRILSGDNDIGILNRASLLRDIALGTSFKRSYQSYGIDWGVLCHLSLGSYHSPVKASCASHISRSAGQLRTCKLHLLMDDDKSPFSAPLLTSLSLSLWTTPGESNWWNTNDALVYFDRMSLPALTHIAYDSIISCTPLVGLLTTKGPQITYLSISNMEGISNLLSCLRKCPRLKELDVYRLNYLEHMFGSREPISSFLDVLMPFKRTEQLHSETCCPELQYLAVRQTFNHDDIDDIISQPRSPPGIKYTPLKGFYADIVEIMSDEITGDTHVLSMEDVQRGLELILQCRVEWRPRSTDPVELPNWWPRPRDSSVWWTV